MKNEKLTKIQRNKINTLKNVLLLKKICIVIDVEQGIECESIDSTLIISITEKNLYFEIFTPDKTFFLVKDIEDYRQKIQKQKQLKNRTIKACKEFLNIEDLEILEYQFEEKVDEILPLPTVPKIEVKKEKPEKYNPAVKPLFKTSYERYEYLMEYGSTCNDDRTWLANYKESKEFKEYENNIC